MCSAVHMFLSEKGCWEAEGGGAMSPHILVNQLTLSKLGRQIMPTTLLTAASPHPPLCVEMGFYADISWESRCNIEINVRAYFYKNLLVFEVPY